MKYFLLRFFCSSMLVFVSLGLSAQADTDSSQVVTDSSRTSIFGLPVVFYTPETRWGFGAAGVFTWRFKRESDESRPSQVQPAFAYTVEDQVLAYLPFQTWWKEELYTVFGELGWYRYNYFYYGVGNDIPQDFEELYGVTYPRLRITAMREFDLGFYAGIRIIADDFEITDLDPDGRLADNNVAGTNGGLNTGVGLILNYDSRDNYLSTTEGTYAEFTLDFHRMDLYSDFSYNRTRLDLRKFFKTGKDGVVALQFFTESIRGSAPFISLALLGGTKLHRGFYEGRYRDKNSASIQAEYRRHVYGRFGVVGFAALGMVAQRYNRLSLGNLRNTWGGGVRYTLNKEERIKIRFDVGVGNGQPAFYLTIGEAF
ncbi:MAG: BamA/TamA family outer membrane protein [Cryomorphaceae bacterium]|nr:outer membrane protein assembly factor [Flavobacteriales bacterium]